MRKFILFLFALVVTGCSARPSESSDSDSVTRPRPELADQIREDGIVFVGTEMYVAAWVNPTGFPIGVFGSQAGSNDWHDAMAVGVYDSTLNAWVFDLTAFANGQSLRYGIATIDTSDPQDVAPANWLSLEEVQRRDTQGWVIDVAECDQVVQNLCVRLDSTGAAPGECALTYDGPACEGGSDDDTDSNTDTASGGTVTKEVCVTKASTAYELAVMVGNDTTHWVTDSGTSAMVAAPIISDYSPSASTVRCAAVTMNEGDVLKFGGWANSGLWHSYNVGSCDSATSTTVDISADAGSRNPATKACATLRITVDSTVNGVSDSDAEQAWFDPAAFDLMWQ